MKARETISRRHCERHSPVAHGACHHVSGSRWIPHMGQRGPGMGEGSLSMHQIHGEGTDLLRSPELLLVRIQTRSEAG